jgi:hypothetical protein
MIFVNLAQANIFPEFSELPFSHRDRGRIRTCGDLSPCDKHMSESAQTPGQLPVFPGCHPFVSCGSTSQNPEATAPGISPGSIRGYCSVSKIILLKHCANLFFRHTIFKVPVQHLSEAIPVRIPAAAILLLA